MTVEVLKLRGPGGEPIDLRRTICSHGLVQLPPMRQLESGRALEVTLAAGRGRPRTLRVHPHGRGRARVTFVGRPPGERQRGALLARLGHVLRLDEDLSEFYASIADDADLAWAARGAGRMIRSPTVFEDVVKTICTTNCAWSATERMVGALVEHLGERAPSGQSAFPTPAAMAAASPAFYRDVVRAGYRGDYLRQLAGDVASGELQLEDFVALPDEELGEALLALPGVGPYAAAHIQIMLGRYRPLILDSWTRPKYAKLVGAKSVADRTIERRFRRYGDWAGLAFWLTVTADWCES